MRQLVPSELLQQSSKILFVAHLALGDFTYMQNCFRAFKHAFPHIKIHLWVDELRRTKDQSQWEHLKNYVVYDWVNECDMFDKVYTRTYSPDLLEQSIRDARSENYPVIVSLATMHRHKYVLLARKINPHGFVVGQKKRVVFYDIPKHLIYRKLDAFIPAYQISRSQRNGAEAVIHISRIYADWFHQLFNMSMSDQESLPYIDIPEKWRGYANQQFADWGFNHDNKTVFLNGFSKATHRSWSLTRVFELASAIKKLPAWSQANIIINVVPESLPEARTLFAKAHLKQVQLFSAEANFFQLPAILSQCQLIISVETAVMHLANAVHVPVIALMRQTTPEWAPINRSITTIIKTNSFKAWVDEITVSQVLDALPDLSKS
jgi:ADP-heptose:LPS heptosyltransferase